MNVPTTIEAVVILIVILLPGYICSVVLGKSVAHISESIDLRYVLRVLAIGTALHAVLFPVGASRLVQQYSNGALDYGSWTLWAWALVSIFVAPIAAGILVGWLVQTGPVDRVLDRIGLGWVDRLPSAWDYASRLGPAWVKVYLTDGLIVGGKFAGKSAASINPGSRDLYIEQVYTLDEDGNLIDIVPDTLGMWVSATMIARVEFLHEARSGYGGNNHGEHTTEPDPSQAAQSQA